jgi:hypothetical protein
MRDDPEGITETRLIELGNFYRDERLAILMNPFYDPLRLGNLSPQ